MANLIREHRIIDNNKRTLVKYVFLSDGTGVANSTLLDASTLRFALNANSQIMSSNTHPRSSYGISIKRIFGLGHLKNNGYVKIQWCSESNTEIVIFNDNNFDFNFEAMGDGATISCPDASPNGDILYTTDGFTAGDTFTLFIDIRKNQSDYDQGQTADPAAFNRGNYSL
jgi:hypothetical protein